MAQTLDLSINEEKAFQGKKNVLKTENIVGKGTSDLYMQLVILMVLIAVNCRYQNVGFPLNF